jgi:hypothetical protein
MPRGRRPSTAALTRLGARKASEMVILTCRVLHFSRAQSSAIVVTRPKTTSSSHRRPRAMAPTRRARRSNCSGRVSLRDALCGSRIWRDFLDGGFCQGIVSGWSSGESDASSAVSDLSLMTSWSLCTTIPATSCARTSRSPKRTAQDSRPVLFGGTGPACHASESSRANTHALSTSIHAASVEHRANVGPAVAFESDNRPYRVRHTLIINSCERTKNDRTIFVCVAFL